MSDSDIGAILNAIRDMRVELNASIDGLRGQIHSMERNGCALASHHAAIGEDHETRLRQVEQYQGRQSGALALVAGVGGGLVASVGGAIWRRITGQS